MKRNKELESDNIVSTIRIGKRTKNVYRMIDQCIFKVIDTFGSVFTYNEDNEWLSIYHVYEEFNLVAYKLGMKF
jgi:hypothetical protein